MRRSRGRHVRGVCGAVGVVAVVAGCGSSSETSEASSSDAPAATVTTSVSLPISTTDSPAAVPPAPTVPPAVPPGKVLAGPQSSCTSAVSATPIDLTGVDVKVGEMAGRAGMSAQVTMTYTGDVPMTGTVLWSLLATNPDGASVQLGYKTLDGQKIGYFYFPFAEGTQQNMDGFADTDTPGEIGMVLPQAGLDALGPVWWWSATVNVDGKDIDFCPDPA
ncbi:hypothetical protein H7J06_26280 [Mycobacterium hodleri]|nr:hypothetical protein [Mycolicibacterium hodleri]